MGLLDNINGLLRTKTGEISDQATSKASSLMRTFSFTSIGGGSGSSATLLYVAQYLAKVENKQVCVIDLNFLQPDLLYNLNVDVTTENTVMNYLKGSARLKDCFIQDAVVKNLHLVTASPKDDVVMLMNLDPDKNLIGNLIESIDMFDVVLINLPYIQPLTTFIEPVASIDRGYLVIDERLSNLKKIDEALDFLHRFQAKANVFNNIVLNKRTDYMYPLELITKSKATLVTELPFERDLVQYMNERVPLVNRDISKAYQMGISDILSDMLD